MVILAIKLNNILAFKDFKVDFSYPMKLKYSLVGNEQLKDVPSFRYKKLNIFIGSNATGKTSLIKSIWRTLLFLNKKEKNILADIVNFKYDNSLIELHYVDEENNNSYLKCIKILTNNTLREDIDIKIAYKSLKLNANNKDSYENRVEDFNTIDDKYENYIDALNEIAFNSGWNAILPATEGNFDNIYLNNFDKEESDLKYMGIINSVLKTLDPAIKSIKRSREVDNAIIINYYDGEKIIVQNGQKMSSIPYLSSGTKYGINIANMMYSISNHDNGIYLIDEQFSYVNSEIELAMLTTMVSMLGDGEQIFFTTHNSNVLTLRYPFHSFYFMKKENQNGEQIIKIDCVSEVENRRNVSPKSILDNDIFLTAPNLDRIYEIAEV